MTWTDRLTFDDELALSRVWFAHGIKPWELYVSLALQIRIRGPLPLHQLDDAMEGREPGLWLPVAGYFELRSDGCMHLKGAMS